MQDNSFKDKKMYLFLFILTLAAYSGHHGWRSIFNNFAVEVAGIDGYQMGVIQSVREIPGFLALLVVYVLLVIAEHRLAVFSIVFFGIGIGLTGFLDTYPGIIVTTLMMSFGFHYYETVNQSLTLQYFTKTEAPIVFARLRGVASLGNIVIGGCVALLLNFLDYKYIYLILGVAISASGAYCYFLDPREHGKPVQRKKMILKAKYWLFYVLTFLAGARRQIFVAFAVFLMVQKFKFTAMEVTLLFIGNNLLNYFTNPYIGKAINRFGERKVLSFEYFSLIWVFLAYAFIDSKVMVAVIYILDHLFFNFHIGIRTYFQKIGEPEDIAPSMAVGFTINHIAAVVIPVIGGLLWLKDYRIPFVGAAVLSLVSLVFSQFIKIPDES